MARPDEQVRLWLAGLRTRRPPRPRVAIDTERSVAAWLLRGACAATALGCTLLVATDAAHWMIAAPLVAAMVVWPSGAALSLFVVGVGVLVLASAGEPFSPRTFVLVLALHLTVQLATIAGNLAWSGRVELDVLQGFARRFAAVQGAAQTAALMGAWATRVELVVPWVAIVAGVVLAGMAWGVLLWIRGVGDRR